MSLPRPVNAEEHYMHAMVVRLDALCNMVSSLVEHIAEKEGITTENNVDTNSDPQCEATTKSGNRCKGTKKEGSKYCAVHSKE